MKELRNAIDVRLVDLHGADQVFFGHAPDNTAMPYTVFRLGISGPSTYNSVTKLRNMRNTIPVTVNTYADDSSECDDRVEAIATAIESSELTMPNDSAVRVDVTSKLVEEDPEREFNGKNTWRGAVIFEVMVMKG